MKILNINAILDPVNGGGTAERTIQMSRYLSYEKEIEVSILTLNLGLTTNLLKRLQGINLVTIPCINKRFYLPLVFDSRIAESIRKSDVVHLMGHWTIINLISYYWIRKYKKPYVVCPAGALPVLGRSKALKKLYNFFGGSAYIRNANMNVAISSDEFDYFYEYGVNPKKTILLPNGIEPKSYRYQDDKHIRDKYIIGEAPFLLFVGRLNFIKGPDLLLKAFAIIAKDYPNYLLIFAGKDGGMENELKESVEKLDLRSRVKFIGFVQDQLKSELYHAADLLVIPSRLEAMSIVVLESAITGTPVLMTNTCGLNEMSGEYGGLSVNPDSLSIAEGLRTLLVKHSELALRGKKLKHYVEKKFYWGSIIKDYVKMYENIIFTSSK
jgi:glycosyltransferase involved in cell wall biosynthesis